MDVLEHLEHDDPETPPIARLIVSITSQDFDAHVIIRLVGQTVSKVLCIYVKKKLGLTPTTEYANFLLFLSLIVKIDPGVSSDPLTPRS